LTFLFVAVLIGAVTGFILYLTSSYTYKALGLEETGQNSTPVHLSTDYDTVRSVAEFRALRKAKKAKKGKQKLVQSPREEKMFQDMLSRVDYVPGASDIGAQGRLPLSNQTILEEDDSSSFEQA
jgi:hypothetical protein